MDFKTMLEGEFNSGLAIVYFIDGLKKGLVNARLEKDYETRYDLLVEYFGELAGQCGDSKREKELLEKHLKYWEDARVAIAKIRDAKSKKDKSILTKELEIFDFWQYELKRMQQVLGVGMPKKSDPRFALASR